MGPIFQMPDYFSSNTFPCAASTTPFWRTDLHPLDDHRSTEVLPEKCDVLIIGGGYAGITAAYHFFCGDIAPGDEAEKPDIVLLEARQACSGATGRNGGLGGHLRPAVYTRIPAHVERFGEEAAAELANFEFDHVPAVAALVDKEKIDCDLVVTKSFDIYTDREKARLAKEAYLDMKARGIAKGTIDDLVWTDEAEAEEISGVKGSVGCFQFTAAHLWPYKLMLHLLQRAVEHGLNLQTCTPCTSICPSTTNSGSWIAATSRGKIEAKKVIFATNGYTAGLLPEYSTKIVPSKGICCRITWPSTSSPPTITRSYGLNLANGSRDYLIPRSDNSIIVGGACSEFFSNHDNWYNNTDDFSLIEPASSYFDNYMQTNFLGWENSQATVSHIWTGIMGYSSDGMPSIGAVPGKENLYIMAGFEGHGMPLILLISKGIVEMVRDGKGFEEVQSVRWPRIFKTTTQRLESEVDVLGPKNRTSRGSGRCQ